MSGANTGGSAAITTAGLHERFHMPGRLDGSRCQMGRSPARNRVVARKTECAGSLCSSERRRVRYCPAHRKHRTGFGCYSPCQSGFARRARRPISLGRPAWRLLHADQMAGSPGTAYRAGNKHCGADCPRATRGAKGCAQMISRRKNLCADSSVRLPSSNRFSVLNSIQ